MKAIGDIAHNRFAVEVAHSGDRLHHREGTLLALPRRTGASNEAFAVEVASRGRTLLDGVSDVDEAAEQMIRAGMRPIAIQPRSTRENVRMRLHVVASRPEVTFTLISLGAESTVKPAEEAVENFMFVLPIAGNARLASTSGVATFSDGVAGMVDPDLEWWTFASEDYACAVMNVQADYLRIVAERVLDGLPSERLRFDLTRDVVSSTEQMVQLLTAAVALHGTHGSSASVRLSTAIETLAVELALLSCPSFQRMHEKHAAADGRAVRTAMSYMSANLDSPLPVGQIAASAHVSVRALQLAFQKELGTTPLRWLREQRLIRTREMITSPEHAAESISDIAHRCGFSHMGDFSRRFRERFGQTATEARAEARSAWPARPPGRGS